MDGRRFLELTFLHCTCEGLPYSIVREGLSCGWQEFSHAKGGRKEPDGMAVGRPIAAQHFQTGLRQRHITVFAPFSMTDMDHLPFPVDILDPQVSAFLDP